MMPIRFLLVLGLACLSLSPPARAAPDAASPAADSVRTAGDATRYRELKWDELMPKDWDPYKGLSNRADVPLSDADPRAQSLLRGLREAWDAAPTVDALNGQRVRLPGYVVPLEEARGELKEFLLVPYFGACIHTPPPPANQIVFVVAPKGVRFRTMDTVWVSGTLRASRQSSFMGSSGYRIEAVAVDAYVAPPSR